MKLWHGPTGRLVRGHVLDVDKQGFDEALRFYDKNLYTVWNPHKLGGWGCWEIRRLPTKKSMVYRGSHQGASFYDLEYVENDLIHHVLDCAFLNYDALRKLKEMDTWGNRQWTHDLERREEEHRETVKRKADEARKYALKQNRSVTRDLYEAVRSGIHPAQILLSSKWRF